MIQPPSVGPRMGATMTPMEKAAMAAPRRAGGKLSMRTACAMGWSAPPPAPWSTRARISISRLVAAPHAADAAVKNSVQVRRTRLRPKRLPSQAVMGSTMALESR